MTKEVITTFQIYKYLDFNNSLIYRELIKKKNHQNGVKTACCKMALKKLKMDIFLFCNFLN